jgi:hypothetical protein
MGKKGSRNLHSLINALTAQVDFSVSGYPTLIKRYPVSSPTVLLMN